MIFCLFAYLNDDIHTQFLLLLLYHLGRNGRSKNSSYHLPATHILSSFRKRLKTSPHKSFTYKSSNLVQPLVEVVCSFFIISQRLSTRLEQIYYLFFHLYNIPIGIRSCSVPVILCLPFLVI